LANIHDPEENIKVDVASAQATLNQSSNAAIASLTYFRLRHYDLVWFFVFTGARTGVASLTCQMYQRIGAAGGTAVLRAAATVITADAVDTSLWARGEELTVNTLYDRVGIRLTESTGANFVVGAICLRLKARYKQATLLTT